MKGKAKDGLFFRRQVLPAVLWLAAVVGFALFCAGERVVTCRYVSIDGDFQSYNVFRRLLAGQRAYADFANYIGMAPVVLNLPWVALAGGSFRASLWVTNFTTVLLFSSAAFLMLWLASGQKAFSLFASAAAAKVVSTQVLYRLLGATAGYLLTEYFTGLYTPSNSMRMARCFLPFLLAGAGLLYARLSGRGLAQSFGRPGFCAVCGALAGLAASWSGDYSLAVLAVLLVLTAVLHAACLRLGWGRWLLCTGAFGAAYAAGMFASAALASGGRPGAWFASFRATGSAQYYYFCGIGRSELLPYLFRSAAFWLTGAPFLIFLIGYTVRMARRRTAGDRGLALYFVCACLMAGTLAYILSGSGYNCREPLTVFTCLFAAGLLVRGLCALLRRAPRLLRAGRYLFLGLLCCTAALLLTQGVRTSLGHTRTSPEGAYIPALGGYNPDTAALTDAAALTQDDPVFSVYATGLEVVKGQFQPTGYDYLIHVLGPDARAAYLDNFKTDGYRWVQTPAVNIDAWIALENWPFYREIFAGYRRAARTEYSWLWEKAGSQELDAPLTLEVLHNADGSVTLQCTSPYTGDFIADVHLRYSTRFTSAGHALANLGRRVVWMNVGPLYSDYSERYWDCYLAGSDDTYVPVVMHGGTGAATLDGQVPGELVFTECEAEPVRALPRYGLFS